MDRIEEGTFVHSGDRLGHASCEGGFANWAHIHIARKYNGEWIMADSPLPFDMEGWIPHDGVDAYKGTLSRGGAIVIASAVSDSLSRITAQE